MNLEEEITLAIGGVLWNASIFPEAAQSRILGADIGPLREKITAAVMPLVKRAQAEAQVEAIRGAADTVRAEARWQQELKMRGAVQKSGAETAVERLLVVEELLRQQAAYVENEGAGA